MINSALTTIQGKTECHSLIWRPFLRQLLINLSKYSPGLVYVLFGTRAKELSMYIGKNNHVLYENHPAYYARKSLAMPTTVFKQIDKLMEMYYENMIWYEED